MAVSVKDADKQRCKVYNNCVSQSEDDVSLTQFIHKLPKVELHAHINGSLSQSTMDRLIDQRVNDVPQSTIQQWRKSTKIAVGETRSLDECFAVFKVIHELVDNEEAVRQVTRDVVAEFAADNVKYLELRTTPRQLPGLSRAAYVAAIVQTLKEAELICGDAIVVRLLLAIDRGYHTAVDAAEIIELADKFRRTNGGRVVGVDLSGNPSVGDARMYLAALREARRRGLKLALHMAEVDGQNDETAALVGLPADRIGHGTYLPPHRGGDDTALCLVDKHKTPVEACLTSNVCLQTVADYPDHHFGFWYKRKHPCIICTDDKGVFSTSLSEEYAHAQKAFGLSRDDLWSISYSAIDSIFESDKVKEQLRAHWTEWREFSAHPDHIAR